MAVQVQGSEFNFLLDGGNVSETNELKFKQLSEFLNQKKCNYNIDINPFFLYIYPQKPLSQADERVLANMQNTIPKL